MDFFTHLVIGIVLAKLLTHDTDKQKIFALGAVAPDLDVIFSWLPSLFPELYFISHRGMFHSLIVMPFVMTALIYCSRYFSLIKSEKRIFILLKQLTLPLTLSMIFFGSIGSYTHLVLDFLNPQGLTLLFPLSSERFTSSTMNFFQIFVSVPAFVFIGWYFLRLYKNQAINQRSFNNWSRIIAVSFLLFVTINAGLHVFTVETQKSDTTSPGFFFYQRWVVFDHQDSYQVDLINQISQTPERTYSYDKQSWNTSQLDRDQVNLLITKAHQTLVYKKFTFNLESFSKIVYNVTYDLDQAKWSVKLTDIINDAQFKYFGIQNESFMGTTISIYVDL